MQGCGSRHMILTRDVIDADSEDRFWALKLFESIGSMLQLARDDADLIQVD